MGLSMAAPIAARLMAAGIDAEEGRRAAADSVARMLAPRRASLAPADRLLLAWLERSVARDRPGAFAAMEELTLAAPELEMGHFQAALEALRCNRPADALRHPTWDMGAKVTIDSATLANKALEVIEAHFLFGVPYERIEAVVHPQSIIHSMVEMVDGSVLAQLGFPTMELPILYALTHPARLPYRTRRFDPVAAGTLTFEPVRAESFPAFALGVQAGRAGGTAPAVFNAANEVAVAAFLAGRLPFTGIAGAVAAALEAHPGGEADSLGDVLRADARARRETETYVEKVVACC